MQTFQSNPTWVKLEDGASIAKNVEATRRAPWGGSTHIPDLIVLSDMQVTVSLVLAVRQVRGKLNTRGWSGALRRPV